MSLLTGQYTRKARLNTNNHEKPMTTKNTERS